MFWRQRQHLSSPFLLLVITLCGCLFGVHNVQSLEVVGSGTNDFVLYGINYSLRIGPDYTFGNRRCKTIDQVRSDMRQLLANKITNKIRVFSITDCDTANILLTIVQETEFADLKLWLGIWVGNDRINIFPNERLQLRDLLDDSTTATAFQQHVIGIHVSSEAIYRGDITIQQAINYRNITETDLDSFGISDIHITISEIIDTNLQYPELNEVDDNVITINMFPFWELSATNINSAAQYMSDRVGQVEAQANGRQIIITETGWADAGSNIDAHLAHPDCMVKWLRDFVCLAKEQNWQYFWYDANDADWQRLNSNQLDDVEGHFGIFDEEGNMKPHLQDLVIDCSQPRTDVSLVIDDNSLPPSVSPTTVAPMDMPPFVAPPTTPSPTTTAPSTASPTTAAPTSLAPSTSSPTATAPTTDSPTTLAPMTLTPTTTAPSTTSPTTASPTTASPTTLAPMTLTPTTTSPTTITPTPVPSAQPSELPTNAPTTPSPIVTTSNAPTASAIPTTTTKTPSSEPSDLPSDVPTTTPSMIPAATPSEPPVTEIVVIKPMECELNSGCNDLGLVGACCPTQSGLMLDCCNDAPAVEETCELNVGCDDLGLVGSCCPTSTNLYLDCCAAIPHNCSDGGECVIYSALEYKREIDEAARQSSSWRHYGVYTSMLAIFSATVAVYVC